MILQCRASSEDACVSQARRSALRREPFSGDGLPTPKRWKRLVPQGTGATEDGGCVPHFLFPRTGVG